jgi:NAD+ diphosphatase
MKYCPQCRAELQAELLDGVERLACSASGCRYVVWDNPVPVVAALVMYQGKLLLARNRLWPEGVYSMITGYLERHESPEAAIVREIKEELGLDGIGVSFIGHYPFKEKNQLIIAYAVTTKGDLKLGEEIADIQMQSLDELHERDFGPLVLTGRIVADWCKQAGQSGKH